jgi:sugar phosphate isomerase/epimerase
MSDDEARRVRQRCDEAGISVSCMGSPIGKSPLLDPIQAELDRLQRLTEIGAILGTKNVRIFSFYPPEGEPDEYVEDAAERLQALATLAEQTGYRLLLENEKGIVGDIPERCAKLMAAVDSPALRFIWDPANFVQCGVADQVNAYWDLLSPYVGYIHIKDAKLGSGEVTPAGQGDGQLPELLAKLLAAGYDDMLAIEPHLKVAGHSSGFSDVDGTTLAVNALREVMQQVGMTEG